MEVEITWKTITKYVWLLDSYKKRAIRTCFPEKYSFICSAQTVDREKAGEMQLPNKPVPASSQRTPRGGVWGGEKRAIQGS